MVAKITMPRSTQKVLNYNEQKVRASKAVCIGGENFLGEAGSLSWHQKLDLFRRRNELNDRSVSRMIHISLNFDPSESLAPEKLNAIAASYMQKIGFGEQPYLVYEHHDAGHPHIHIVSTAIRPDGSRISTHNLGRNQSEKARKDIEVSFRLVRAETAKKRILSLPKESETPSIVYGEGETRQRMSRIVRTVTGSFCYTSLAELNAVLKRYNIVADAGTASSRMRTRQGLCYHLLNRNGNKAGVPFKASSLPGKPTLSALETYFEKNKTRRASLKPSLQAVLASVLSQKPADLPALEQLLSKKNIFFLLRTNADGKHYGITFIDMQNRCVFNGSDLGKEYSIAALQKTLSGTVTGNKQTEPKRQSSHSPFHTSGSDRNRQSVSRDIPPAKPGLLQELITPVQPGENIPAPLLQKKGKRKKKKPYS